MPTKKAAPKNGKVNFYSGKFTAQTYWDTADERNLVRQAAAKSGKALSQYIAEVTLAAARKDLKS